MACAVACVVRAEPAPGVVQPKWEGALGPVARVTPEYTGGASQKFSVTPGFFLRYGRLSISNTGAFVTRRRDDVVPGVGADLRLTENVRTHFGLRLDRGRSTTDSGALRGLDSIRATVRGRLSSTWTPRHDQPLEGWRPTLALTADLLGRGGGQTVDLSLGRDFPAGERLIWSVGFNLAAASGEYMRRYYGVTPDEAQRTGYRVYEPHTGWRDLSVSTGWRMEINPQWVSFWGGSMGRLVGPAAGSPLTARPTHWELNGGIARRF